MAIAFDAATDGAFVNPATSHTYSHTCTGSDRALFVAIVGDFADVVTGVTYAGVSMTRIDEVRVGSDRYVYLYGLLNPASGANNVVVSASASIFLLGVCSSYTGADTSGSMPDASNTNSVTGGPTTLTTSVTTVADNCWSVLAAYAVSASNMTAGTGSTERKEDTTFHRLTIYDSNAAITPAGSYSMTCDSNSGDGIGHVIGSFAPPGGGGGDTKAYLLGGDLFNGVRLLGGGLVQ